MAKQGMKRPETKHRKNDFPPVPTVDRIPDSFPAIDNDLAVENLTNDFDMTAADLQDLR